MTRPLVLSNGELHVGINNFGQVHDFYYPYVGLENHVAGHGLRHHVGVWIEGQISWLDRHTHEWVVTFDYPHEALIGRTVATNETRGIRLEFEDAVDSDQNVFMRNIHVINLRDTTREVRLFMHQAFVIGDSRSHTDTAQFLPDSEAILHYRGHRVFVVGGLQNGQSFDQHSIGLFGSEDHEGTFRDAEDGELSMSNVEHGRVDSTIRFTLSLTPHDSGRVQYWIAAGKTHRETLRIHRYMHKNGVSSRLHVTLDWWTDWLQPTLHAADRLEPSLRTSFIKSVMIIKSHIDKRGAVIASTDSAVLNYSRDTYAYCWPRDGAYVLWPLIRLGYTEEPLRFFEFCQNVMHPAGYLMHKFRADGALGSSWHPYAHDDVNGPPIQEDETALVLFMFAQYYQLHPSPDLIASFYESMVKPMADFLANHIDDSLGLPKPSYDLWEERYTTSTYTTATVYAALSAAADIAESADDNDSAVTWRSTADDIRIAAQKHLYSSSRKMFYKGVELSRGQITARDDTVDSSSVFGVFMYGLFAPDSTEFQAAMATLQETFSVTSVRPHLPRYENDGYYKSHSATQSNWWIICTLWLAQYYVDTDQMERALDSVTWVQSTMLSSGVLPEQIDTSTGKSISVAPLVWSHAEYVGTLLDIITKSLKK